MVDKHTISKIFIFCADDDYLNLIKLDMKWHYAPNEVVNSIILHLNGLLSTRPSPENHVCFHVKWHSFSFIQKNRPKRMNMFYFDEGTVLYIGLFLIRKRILLIPNEILKISRHLIILIWNNICLGLLSCMGGSWRLSVWIVLLPFTRDLWNQRFVQNVESYV